ncbi:MAG: hypothetical protein ACTSVL_12245 [Promethearchaeota archaeon]
MIYSKPNINGPNSTQRLDLTRIREFIQYLKKIYKNKPFNFEEIANKLQIPIEEVVEYFNVVTESFRLFHKIQENKLLKKEDIFTTSKTSRTIIEISVEEMKSFCSFVYILQKQSSKRKNLKLSENTRILIKKYPDLFKLVDSKIQASSSGSYFASEFEKYQKINSKINKMEYKNIQLIIKKNN